MERLEASTVRSRPDVCVLLLAGSEVGVDHLAKRRKASEGDGEGTRWMRGGAALPRLKVEQRSVESEGRVFEFVFQARLSGLSE